MPEKFKLSCPNNVCKKEHEYKREDVIAEPSNGTGAGGAVVGGLLGLVGGPLGLIIGAIIGGVIGASTDQSDSEAANKFNSGG
ncbi:hypothetical protein M1384_04035 [Candidatus Parvarchaeota archaeon]|nr:hypothetical protein [Candidatus Parvarchaeota archaeon]MCL5976443.1 hypothetical protein [Candidatus Parvarchaeota archaeon]